MAILNGLTQKIESNATLAAMAAGVWLRSKEVGGTGLTTILETALYEAVKTFQSFDYVKYKLWDAGHTPQAITKAGLIVYAASELGLINKKALGKKIIKGGVLASIITPGSGPDKMGGSFLKQANPISQYPY